jgi:hypothetical protein
MMDPEGGIMGISSHRGKVQIHKAQNPLDDEVMNVFELFAANADPGNKDVAGYFLKKHGTTQLPYPLPSYDEEEYHYTQYVVAFAEPGQERRITPNFGVDLSWRNDTGLPAYLGVFKGYHHPLGDLVGRKEVASYYIMVVNRDKHDPEDQQFALAQASIRLTINLEGAVTSEELANIQLHYAPVIKTEPANAVQSAELQSAPTTFTLSVDGLDNSFQTGAYTVTLPKPPATQAHQPESPHEDQASA